MARALKFEIPIEIKSADVVERGGTARATGKVFKVREQHGWVDLGKAYPQEIVLKLEHEEQPYAVGAYVVDARSLYVDRFGQLQIGRLKLTLAGPVPVAQGAGG